MPFKITMYTKVFTKVRYKFFTHTHALKYTEFQDVATSTISNSEECDINLATFFQNKLTESHLE